MKEYIEKNKVINVLEMLIDNTSNKEIQATLKLAIKIIMLLPVDISIK